MLLYAGPNAMRSCIGAALRSSIPLRQRTAGDANIVSWQAKSKSARLSPVAVDASLAVVGLLRASKGVAVADTAKDCVDAERGAQ